MRSETSLTLIYSRRGALRASAPARWRGCSLDIHDFPISPPATRERETLTPCPLPLRGREGVGERLRLSWSRTRCARSHSLGGFTLVEVLVALAVVAVVLSAVMHSFGQSIDTTIALRERTVALWVAQNRLAMHYAVRDWPTPDTTEGTTDMAGREWRWREQVATTPDADMRRVEIEVRAAPGREAAAHLIGFLPRPVAAP